MLSVDRLRMLLPAGMEHRSARIAREVANELANLQITESARIETLSLPAMQVTLSHSDQQIAKQIASSISRAITQQAGSSVVSVGTQESQANSQRRNRNSKKTESRPETDSGLEGNPSRYWY